MGEFANTLKESIEGGMVIGLTTYPIFNETYRTTLNNKIINHYLYCELGFELEERFIHRINGLMTEIMPFYNKQYQSELLTIDPLLSFSRTDNSTSSNSVESSGNNSGTQGRVIGVEETTRNETSQNSSNRADVKQIESDTPQALLTINDIDGSVYASKAMLNQNIATDTMSNENEINSDRAETETQTNSSLNSANTTGNSTSEITSSGYDRPLTELLQMYRDTFLNVDLQIINELEVCFMGVY